MRPHPLATALMCDAAPHRIAMDARIRAVWRGAKVAGPAFTVRTPPGEHAAVREAAGLAPAGSVIVVDAGGDIECALWGDRMSRFALERGVAGVVIDGAVRDVDEIEALGFPVFAVATAPTPPGRERRGEINVVVSCGGLGVSPGDVVYGDSDGVVAVPSGIHDEVVERAHALTKAAHG